jgi:hypothetical protein
MVGSHPRRSLKFEGLLIDPTLCYIKIWHFYKLKKKKFIDSEI